MMILRGSGIHPADGWLAGVDMMAMNELLAVVCTIQ
jgi:hypothetical protein